MRNDERPRLHSDLRAVLFASMLAAGAGFAIAACTNATTAPTPPRPSSVVDQFLSYQSSRFTFRYTTIDAASVAATAAHVEKEHERITGDLGVAAMPNVVVTLYPNIEALRQAVAPMVGSVPSFATGLVTGVDAVHILSPNSSASSSYSAGVTGIVHEFAHCVSLQLNPGFGNNPRWLWESVALFEALQYDDFRTRPYVTAGGPPSLAQLSSLDNTIVYGVGAWLGLFIEETRGRDTYRALIRANGDLGRVLDTNESAFLAEWTAFVRTRLQMSQSGRFEQRRH